MARPRPRRPRPGRGLPPPERRSPEEQAEDDRLRAELVIQCARMDAILADKWAEAAEQVRIQAERAAAGAVFADDDPWF
ncbi:MAG: hypothetical protein KJ911_05575 [Alphaproteobacteria bacterium]|uniref:Uncharacterized protein n=1 Tax=Brevundimonas mediterranea TaxID=74329 RepID=A0A7Z9C802_9CAUL|nr:hypothetical protein [Brevundimonas mediterranea]MBU4196210.1 hypothetical protein [Alphaproteobacteria bacterium]VDC51378.1 hypothetical protein BREV_BREV_02731 [Brevundimonas mediterranea]